MRAKEIIAICVIIIMMIVVVAGIPIMTESIQHSRMGIIATTTTTPVIQDEVPRD